MTDTNGVTLEAIEAAVADSKRQLEAERHIPPMDLAKPLPEGYRWCAKCGAAKRFHACDGEDEE